MPPTLNCGLDADCILVYSGVYCMIAQSRNVAATCSDGILTATATFSDWVAPPCESLAVPTHSITVSIPIENNDPKVCCTPCPIPQQNLKGTLVDSFGGHTPFTAVYDGISTWTGTVSTQSFVLDCDGGQLSFCLHDSSKTPDPNCCTTTGDWSIAAYSCLPFHLDFQASPTVNMSHDCACYQEPATCGRGNGPPLYPHVYFDYP
jgi:hypothetical protein